MRLVPNFYKALLTAGEGVTAAGVKSAAPVSITQGDPVLESAITDTKVLEISMEYRGIQIDNVLIDGGAGVNIVTKTTCERFGWRDWLPVPFLVRMADQRRVRGYSTESGAFYWWYFLCNDICGYEYGRCGGRV